jgi:hypothetical protein
MVKQWRIVIISGIKTKKDTTMQLQIRRFDQHSLKADCVLRGAVGIIHYRGVMTQISMQAIQPHIADMLGRANCLVFRVDKAAVAMTTVPPLAQTYYRARSAPGAIIVRGDQYELMADYAAAMAAAGFRRCVFFDSQLDLCRQWVDWQLEAAAAP